MSYLKSEQIFGLFVFLKFIGERMDLLKKVGGFAAGFLIVTLVMNFIGGGDKLKDFEPFESVEGRFSVSMPGEPEKITQTVSHAAGELDFTMFSAGSKEVGFVVGYSDYPEEIIYSTDPKTLLDGARDGAVTNVQGELLNEKVLDVYGSPAREIEVNVQDKGILTARLILVDRRFYQVMTMFPPDEQDINMMMDFFDSFTINAAK